MSLEQETELESEFEHELHETEAEAGLEGEGILGSIGSALGGLLGEGESAGESEAEFEGLGEFEAEFETESEFEMEHEHGEQFFGSIGRFLKKAAPVLKQIAKVAAPMVGTAIGGPFGTVLGGLAAKALGEQELELELEGEGESEFESELETEFETEAEHESEHEVASEISTHETSMHEALAEMMAEAAAHETQEGHAEAMAGAAVVTVLSPGDRRALRRLLPHLVRGAGVLTRILRRRRLTRPAVRAVPTIVRRTVRSLKRQAAAGRPITRRTAARTAAAQVRAVLGSPRACGAAITRNIRAGRALKRQRRGHRAVAG